MKLELKPLFFSSSIYQIYARIRVEKGNSFFASKPIITALPVPKYSLCDKMSKKGEDAPYILRTVRIPYGAREERLIIAILGI